jgi:hypothetical protein
MVSEDGREDSVEDDGAEGSGLKGTLGGAAARRLRLRVVIEYIGIDASGLVKEKCRSWRTAYH